MWKKGKKILAVVLSLVTAATSVMPASSVFAAEDDGATATQTTSEENANTASDASTEEDVPVAPDNVLRVRLDSDGGSVTVKDQSVRKDADGKNLVTKDGQEAEADVDADGFNLSLDAAQGTQVPVEVKAQGGYHIETYRVTTDAGEEQDRDLSQNQASYSETLTMPEGAETIEVSFAKDGAQEPAKEHSVKLDIPDQTYGSAVLKYFEDNKADSDHEIMDYGRRNFSAGQILRICMIADPDHAADLTLTDADGNKINTSYDKDMDAYTFTMPDSDVTAHITFRDMTAAELEAGTTGETPNIFQRLLRIVRPRPQAASDVKLNSRNGSRINYDSVGCGDSNKAKSERTSLFIVTYQGQTYGTAYCVDPRAYPSFGATGTATKLSNDSQLAKVLYYGYAGPGRGAGEGQSNALDTALSGQGLPDGAALIITHMAAAKVSPQGSGWSAGSGTRAQNAVNAFITSINSLPAAPDTFEAYSCNMSKGQDLAFWKGGTPPKPPTPGHVNLQKISANSNYTNGNEYYSLEGAEYSVRPEDSRGEVIGTLTTDKNGNSNTLEVEPDTYLVQETKASKGFELDPKVYTVTVGEGETATVQSVEPLGQDPFAVVVRKNNTDVGTDNPKDMSKTVFKLTWYAGEFGTKASADASGVARRTFYIATSQKNGSYCQGRLDQSSVQAAANLGYRSDALTYSDNGLGLLNYGTVVIEEAAPAPGYKNDANFTVYNNGAAQANQGSAAVINFDKGSASTVAGTSNSVDAATGSDHQVYGGAYGVKDDYLTGGYTQGNASFAGAEFTVYNDNSYDVKKTGSTAIAKPGEAVAVLTADASGRFQSGPKDFATGKYKVKETKPPKDANGHDMYLLNSDWEGTFTIPDTATDGNAMEHIRGVNGNPDDVHEKPSKGGGAVIKLDHERATQIAQGDGHLYGAEFSIYNVSDHDIVKNDDKTKVATAGYYTTAQSKEAKAAITKADGTYNKDYLVTTITTSQGTNDTMGSTVTLPVEVNGQIQQMTIDNNGLAKTGQTELPYGTYVVVETKAPEGYRLNRNWAQVVNVDQNGVYQSITMSDDVLRGEVKGQKIDVERDKNVAQGDATLKGAQYSVYNISKHEVISDRDRDGKLDKNADGSNHLYPAYSRDEVLKQNTTAEPCLILTTDKNGNFTSEDTALNDLPYGTYIIKETKPSTGYLLNTTWYKQFSIRGDEDGNMHVEYVNNNPSRSEGKTADFTVNTSAKGLLTTDGVAPEQVIRGGVYLRKGDALWPDLSDYSAGEDLSGIKFDIRNVSTAPETGDSYDAHVLVPKNSKEYKVGDIVATIVVKKGTDANGKVYYYATTDADGDGKDYTLPYGTYTLTERKTDDKNDYKTLVNDDYGDTLNKVATFQIREDGKVVTKDKDGNDLIWVGNTDQAADELDLTEATDRGESIKGNNPVRGDLNFDKKALDSQQPLRAAFLLTNIKTHESHIIVTDKAGTYNSNEVFHAHDVRTNANDALAAEFGLKLNADGSIADQNYNWDNGTAIAVDKLQADSGTWFGLGQNGTMAKTVNTVGALPKGTYRMQELKTTDTEDLNGLTITFQVGSNQNRPFADVDLSTLNNGKWDWESSTEGTIQDGASRTRFIYANSGQTFSDEIRYYNLPTVGADGNGKTVKYEYKVNGELRYAKDFGKHKAGDVYLNADGNKITSETLIKAGKSSGTFEQQYTIDATDLGGATLNVYNTLYQRVVDSGDSWKAIGYDRDITNVRQSIYVPGIDTTALNTKAAQEYATYDANGKVTIHKNEDLLSTKGAGSVNDHIAKAGSRITVTDTVDYKNLMPNHKYTLRGYVVPAEDAWKQTGQFESEREINTLHGKHSAYGDQDHYYDDAAKEATFVTPNGTSPVSGSQDVKFTFDVDQSLEGKDLVVFEELYLTISNDTDVRLWGTHYDTEDFDQMIKIPSVRTKAFDALTGDDVGTDGDSVILSDTVSYKNVIAGENYTVEGRLVNKKDGSPITDADGKQITSSTTFTAADENGEVTLNFTVPSNEYKNVTVNVYEDLIHAASGVSVAEHMKTVDTTEDVHYPDIHTNAIDSRTGDHVGSIFGALINSIRKALGEKDVSGDGIDDKTEQTIYDGVTLQNLVPGREYTISGKLMNRDNGEQITAAGKKIEGKATVTVGKDGKVTAKDAEGNSLKVSDTVYDQDQNRVDAVVTMVYKVDSSELQGVATVVFEDLIHNGVTVATHENLFDDKQTVSDLSVHTTAVDAATGDHVGDTPKSEKAWKDVDDAKTSTIRDTVNMTKLVSGMEYTVHGYLVVADESSDGKIAYLKADGTTTTNREEAVQAEKTFTADANGLNNYKADNADHPMVVSGNTVLTFPAIDTEKVEGHTIVVFEDIWHNGVKITTHSDPKDEDQSVHYPKVRTNASDTFTGDDVGTVGYTNVVDKVSYKNLIPSQAYTVTGYLVYQHDFTDANGKTHKQGDKVLDKNGNVITASEELAAGSHEADGTVTLTFTVDSSLLKGGTVVAFERLEHNDVKVATHADIYDKPQTVHYPDVHTNAKDKDTGDHAGSIWGALINGVRNAIGDKDADGNGIPDSKQQNIIDTVTLTNLVPGRTYTVSGKLYDEATGEALVIDGKEITQTATIKVTEDGKIELAGGNGENITVTDYDKTNNDVDGTIDLVYALDSSKLANKGTTIVVFEDLIHNDVTVATHHDIKDRSQAVNDVEIHTTAVDSATKDQVGQVPGENTKKTVTIDDTVNMTKLVKGYTYTVTGRLVDQDKSTADKPVYFTDASGKAITGTVTFKADENDPAFTVTDSDDFSVSGTVHVTFDIDNDLVQGKTLTVFEDLYHNGVKITTHADITDASQSVYYPTGKTNLTDDTTTKHSAIARDERTITDNVYFDNLLVGKTYTLSGELMYQNDYDLDGDGKADVKAGDVLPDEGAKATVTFTASSNIEGAENVEVTTHTDGTQTVSGYIPLHFTIDASKLAGTNIVAAEETTHNDVTVFVHKDIKDLPETVRIPKITTTAKTEDLDENTVYNADGTFKDVPITDTVHYKNLWTPEELQKLHDEGLTIKNGKVVAVKNPVYDINETEKYTVKGTLVYKDSGEPVVNNKGEQYVTYVTFTPDKADGDVDVTFTINAGDFLDENGESALEGKSLTVFEDLYEAEDQSQTTDEENHVAEHHDTKDTEQDIRFPKGRTHANDGIDGALAEGEHNADEASANHEVEASKAMNITDRVSYSNLHGGTKYTVTGTLQLITAYNDDGTVKSYEPAKDDKGNVITQTKEFTTEGSYDDEVSGTVDITFGPFSGLDLAGKTTVAFEKFTREGQDVMIHADINDAPQQIHIPEIHTNAWGHNTPEDFHEVLAHDNVTIYDQVSYKNLKAGETYTVQGVLVDKATGKPIEVDGKQVTAEKTFTAGEEDELYKLITGDVKKDDTAEDAAKADDVLAGVDTKADQTEDDSDVKAGVGSPDDLKSDKTDESAAPDKAAAYVGTDGTITIPFTFDASALEGRTLVVFETLYNGKTDTAKETPAKEVAEHKDVNDNGQTVTIPKIRTEAQSDATKSHAEGAKKEVTITDTVKYTNLHVGQMYTAKGTLMVKSTGKALEVDGKPVTAVTTFRPDKADGTVALKFTFDSSALEGETVVAFEKVYRQNILVGVHEDLNDEDQSIHIPKIHTNAADAATKTQQGRTFKDAVVVDTVSYTNLVPKTEYKISGYLVDKTTGQALEVNGKKVTAERTFMPDKADGSIQLEFKFDASALKGKTLVAFETLYVNNVDVAVHTDINDKDQTVYLPEIHTNASDSETKSSNGNRDNDATVTDVVSYSNLIKGKTYTVTGQLMDKQTGKPVVGKDGKAITASQQFTAEDTNGTVTVTFHFDATLLKGEQAVVFETLYDENNVELTDHADINDAAQTVTYKIVQHDTKTGDMPIWPYALALAAGAAVLGTVYAKRRKNKKQAN